MVKEVQNLCQSRGSLKRSSRRSRWREIICLASVVRPRQVEGGVDNPDLSAWPGLFRFCGIWRQKEVASCQGGICGIYQHRVRAPWKDLAPWWRGTNHLIDLHTSMIFAGTHGLSPLLSVCEPLKPQSLRIFIIIVALSSHINFLGLILFFLGCSYDPSCQVQGSIRLLFFT